MTFGIREMSCTRLPDGTYGNLYDADKAQKLGFQQGILPSVGRRACTLSCGLMSRGRKMRTQTVVAGRLRALRLCWELLLHHQIKISIPQLRALRL